jgi:hypothetical protein
MAYSKLENGLKYTIMIRLFWCFGSRMNKLVYIYVPNEFVIGQYIFLIIEQNACRSYGEQDESNKTVGVLRRVSQSTRKTLFNTLVLPHYDYCSPVWDSLPKTHIHRLQRIQNRGMRIILDIHPHSHANDLLHEPHFMSVHQRFILHNCTLILEDYPWSSANSVG